MMRRRPPPRPRPARTRETIDLWVSDFLDRPAARDVAARVGAAAQDVLGAFLDGVLPRRQAARRRRGRGREPRLPRPRARRSRSTAGRARPCPSSSPRSSPTSRTRAASPAAARIAARVRAAEPAFRDRAAGKAPDLTRRAAKIGRNDPCPCGSGRKYKQCCLRTLGAERLPPVAGDRRGDALGARAGGTDADALETGPDLAAVRRRRERSVPRRPRARAPFARTTSLARGPTCARGRGALRERRRGPGGGEHVGASERDRHRRVDDGAASDGGGHCGGDARGLRRLPTGSGIGT